MYHYGTDADEQIVGSSEADVLYGYGGNDDIFAGAGNDYLFGGLGIDHMEGGAGNDKFIIERADWGGSAPNALIEDAILGGEGYDTVEVKSAAGDSVSLYLTNYSSIEAVNGGAGNDILNGAEVGNAALALNGGEGNDQLTGGAWNDKLTGGFGDDYLLGGAGNDTLQGDYGFDTLIGGAGNDKFVISASDWGTDGDNLLLDVIVGGEGYDTIEYQTYYGRTKLYLQESLGIEQVNAGNGRDYVDASSLTSAIVVDGRKGDDVIWGGSGNDVLFGGDGNDYLWGSFGNDTIDGSFGNDQLFGAEGDDSLQGWWGDDELFGGAGNDRLDVGHTGNTRLSGGEGNDTFIMHLGSAQSTALDFKIGEDKIKFHTAIYGLTFDQMLRTPNLCGENINGDTWIAVDNARLTLVGVKLADLSAADFEFAFLY